MEEELKLIKKLGVVTSRDINNLIDKNIRTIIRNLNRLESFGEIKIIEFKSDKIRRRVYIDGEVYNNITKTKKRK